MTQKCTPTATDLPRRSAAGWRIYGTEELRRVGVSNQGWDLYRVQHEHDVQQYRIALGDDGKVYGFAEASSEAQTRALI